MLIAAAIVPNTVEGKIVRKIVIWRVGLDLPFKSVETAEEALNATNEVLDALQVNPDLEVETAEWGDYSDRTMVTNLLRTGCLQLTEDIELLEDMTYDRSMIAALVSALEEAGHLGVNVDETPLSKDKTEG